MSKTNPIIRAIENGRATPEEIKEAFFHLMERDELSHINPNRDKRQELVLVADTLLNAKKLLIAGDEIKGLRSGYRHLDEMTRGINPSEIVVLFADTGAGKSQLAQNVALNLAVRHHPVLYIGLEMNNTENTVRFLQMHGEEEGFGALPILYPASNDLKYQDVASVVKAAKDAGVELVVIDHLHMFETGSSNRADGIEDICREFKRVARTYEIPILLISHTNRGSEGRGVPHLRDLKGSSAIEQIADIAITLWKDPNADQATAPLKVVLRKQRKGWKRDSFTLEPDPAGNGRLMEEIEMSAFPTV